MIAVLCPGQGAQSPGMLSAWLELPGARERVGHFGELAGLDLIRLGTTADAADITDTAVTQPLIVAAGLVAAAELDLGDRQVAVAGHSVGELTAVAVAGVLSDDDAVTFAARRGAAMAAACALSPTGMSAVLGGEADEVVAALDAAGLTAANRNGAGQIVAAGPLEALAALADDPPAGARVRPLSVAGAFHTSAMQPAEDSLGEVAAGLTPQDPVRPLLSDLDGALVTDGADMLARLVRQVTRSVRWDQVSDTLRSRGVTDVIELAPAGTLVGLARRDLPGVGRVALKTPDDLEAARALLAAQDHPAAHPSDVEAERPAP